MPPDILLPVILLWCLFFLVVSGLSLYAVDSLYILDAKPLYLLQIIFPIYEFFLMRKVLNLNVVEFINQFLYGECFVGRCSCRIPRWTRLPLGLHSSRAGAGHGAASGSTAGAKVIRPATGGSDGYVSHWFPGKAGLPLGRGRVGLKQSLRAA